MLKVVLTSCLLLALVCGCGAGAYQTSYIISDSVEEESEDTSEARYRMPIKGL